MKSKKKETKVEKHKEVKKTEVKKKNIFLRIWLPIIIIVVVVAVLLLALPKSSETSGKDVIAKVNGQPIYKADFLEKKAQIPAGFEAVYTNEIILNQTIMEALLIKFAEDKGIIVTAEETKKIIENNMAEKGMTMEALMTQLEQIGKTFDEFVDLGRKQLLIMRGLEEIIPLDSMEVTDDEIQATYDNLALENKTLEETKDQIIEMIKGQKYQAKVGEVIEDLMSKADIEILVDLKTIV